MLGWKLQKQVRGQCSIFCCIWSLVCSSDLLIVVLRKKPCTNRDSVSWTAREGPVCAFGCRSTALFHQSSWIKSVQQKDSHLICVYRYTTLLYLKKWNRDIALWKCMHYRICPRTEIAMVVSCYINVFNFLLVMIVLCSILNKNCLSLLSLVIWYILVKLLLQSRKLFGKCSFHFLIPVGSDTEHSLNSL